MLFYSVLLLLLPSFALSQSCFKRVWGGIAANIACYKYAVLIKFDSEDVGSGTILTYRWVLCTAHQAFGPARRYGIIAGSSADDRNGTWFEVEDVVKHPEYGPDVDYDLGMMKTKRNFDFHANMGSVTLGYAGGIQGAILTMVSFGPDSKGKSGQLRAALYVVATPENCVADVRHLQGGEANIRSNRGWCMVPIPEKVGGTCFGDAGSPVVRTSPLIGSILFGVVAYANKRHCGGNATTVVVNVGPFIPWIYKILNT